MESSKWVYFFSKQNTDGSKDLKELLGGKGKPRGDVIFGAGGSSGFTITTRACLSWRKISFPQK